MHSSRNKKSRQEIVAAIQKALADLPIQIETQEKNREVIIHLIGPKLKAMVSAEPQDTTPIIHWHSAQENLQRVPGAWSSINTYHYRKATSVVSTWEDLIATLRTGFLATIDGTAFATPVEALPS